MKVGGIVLGGGASQRMGRAKAWLPFAGELMLPRVVRLLATVVQPVVVVAAPAQELPPLPADVVMARDEARGRGPLQGIAGGLAALAGQVDAAYVSACDVPLLRPAFARRMIELLGEHAICVPCVAGVAHPLAAVYRLDVLPVVRRLLAADQLRLSGLLTAVPTRRVNVDELADVDPTLQSLRNLNTMAEYEAAVRDAKTWPA